MGERDDEIVAVLKEIRDNQRSQLEASREYFERAKAIQDRAEQIQAKSAALVDRGRRVIAIILPVVIVLIIYVSWLIFRR